MWNKFLEKLDKKTSPTEPLLTGNMVERFFLRLLLMVLVYVVINTFIIPLKIWEFIVIDALIYVSEFLQNLTGGSGRRK
jgi:hypothetical protein